MQIDALIEKLVDPFYMEILGNNFLALIEDDRHNFVERVREALISITTADIEQLLSHSNWRDRIAASWFTGLKGWKQFTPQIGDFLLESRMCYAGQGYCFALANFADTDSVNYLCRYLDIYLPQTDKFYDQGWALSALLWLDEINETAYAQPYLLPNGLWERFIAGKQFHGAWDINNSYRDFHSGMTFCAELCS